eukprot:12891548-Prorocentrum_lima.AAC.1
MCKVAECHSELWQCVYFGRVLPSSVACVFHSEYLRPYPLILLHMRIGLGGFAFQSAKISFAFQSAKIS